MTKTKRETVTEALRHIGVVAGSETPDADDYAAAAGHYDSILAALDDLHEVAVSFTADAVPDWAYLPLAQMVAGSICTQFERPQYRGEYQNGLRAFRSYASNESRVDGDPVRTVYF